MSDDLEKDLEQVREAATKALVELQSIMHLRHQMLYVKDQNTQERVYFLMTHAEAALSTLCNTKAAPQE